MNPSKTSQTGLVLNVILVAFLAIVFRIWHLSMVQREDRLAQAKRPQERSILLRADRGVIVDRFGIPLAENKICYKASIYYNQISQIPAVSWQDGQKQTPRKDYIQQLSQTLSQELGLDALDIEDQIYSRASLFPHVPFVLKSHLSESEHYRLKMLEKDWPGLCAEITSERVYPQGPVACHLIGRMGSISQKEYQRVAAELAELQQLFDQGEEEVYPRLQELKEKAYTLSDLVGKTGLEGQFEEQLRGFYGKQIFEVDQKGRFLRQLPGNRKATPGKKIVLSISAELQKYAEELLAQDEVRRRRSFWIKGGGLVALDPNTGEVLAMASYPRFDPNDFIPSTHPEKKKQKQKKVCRWLENEQFLAAVWEGRETLQRKGEKKRLTWDLFLELAIPPNAPAKAFFSKPVDLKTALESQEDPLIQDLCRLAVDPSRFNEELIARYGSMKLSDYRHLNQEFCIRQAALKEECEKAFHKTEFANWRKEHQKEFLAEKRLEEKQKRTYARPYLDYLEQKEKELFAIFWQEKRLALLSEQMQLPVELIQTFRTFKELTEPLSSPKKRGFQTLKDLACIYSPPGGFNFSKSYAYQIASPPGSVFKLITAYEALKQQIPGPVLVDSWQPNSVAVNLNGTVYSRIYKGGRLPRSHAPDLGKVDFLGALEQSSNPYFSILAGDFFKDPNDLSQAAKSFGFGEKSNLDLPQETAGTVPTDLRTNRTGLYSTAIGQHTLLATPLQCALSIALIANGGHLLKPKITLETDGKTPDRDPLQAFASQDYLAKQQLYLLGVPFPLFTAANSPAAQIDASLEPTEIRRILPLSPQMRSQLLEGMDRAVWGPKGSARPTAIRQLWSDPLAMRTYLSLEHQMLGKTGTAEILSSPYRVPDTPRELFKHVWFGAVDFPNASWTDADLVVVAFLRYGDGGKDAAPLAAKVIQKWREIKKLKTRSPDFRTFDPKMNPVHL